MCVLLAECFIHYYLRYLRHLQEQAKIVGESPAGASTQQVREDVADNASSLVIGQTSASVPSNMQQGNSSHGATSLHMSIESEETDKDREFLTTPFTLPSMTVRNQQSTPQGWGKPITTDKTLANAYHL